MMTITTILGAVVALASLTLSVETTYVDIKPNSFIINSVYEFVNFANSVNNGTPYLGTTVYLNSNIVFSEESSEQFEPIGKDSLNYFNGVFDGQGHIISNLKIDSASSFTGLFGYSEGLIIKNVVLDDSCSITFSYSGPIHSIGGIIGYCLSEKGACIIENSINMASITFNGGIYNSDLNIGGIAGFLSSNSLKYSIIIKNCANYGSITHSGKTKQSFIGGIIGASSGYFEHKYIQNCFNYGTTTHSGTTSKELYMGGIAGYSRYTYVENCLSAGKISVSESSLSKSWHFLSSYQEYIGSIVGYVNSETYIKYCFWTCDVGVNKINECYGKPNTTGIPTSPLSASGAVNELNAQTSSSGGKNWNKWIYNPNRRNVKFSVNGNKHLSLSSQAILLPDIVSSSTFSFSGWYTDSGYSKPFGDNEIISDKELYGIYNKKVIVKFYSNIWDIFRKPAKEVTLGGAYGELLKPTREGYTFDGWFTDKHGNTKIEPGTKVKTGNDHTLYAHWTPNSYNVTLDANGGDNPPFNQIIKVTYDDTYKGIYGELVEELTRTGYTFNGWYTKKDGGDKVCSFTTVTTAYDHTLYAQWTANKYTVTYDVNGGNELQQDQSTKIVTYYASYGYLTTPTKTGYTFTGWYTKKDGGDKVESTTTVTIIGNHKIYAHWVANRYIVTYDVNGGDDLPKPVLIKEVTYDAPYGDLIKELTREGYTFIGWFTDRIGGDKVESNTIVTTDKNHDIYAHWTANSYTVTFDVNGGCDLSKSVSTKIVTYDAPYGDLVEAPKRTGYTFDGWYSNNNEDITDESIVKTAGGHTLYAHWTANNYTVTFDVNGGVSLSKPTRIVVYDASYGYLETPARKGYTFTGWYTKKDEGDIIESTTIVTIIGNHTLYAHWTPNNYTITYDVNSGDPLSNPTRKVTYNISYGYLVEPTKAGYTFDGWFTDRIGGDKVESNAIVNTANNHTLYAHWTGNNYIVTFNVNGGNPLSNPTRIIMFGNTYGDLLFPERDGYKFDGWYSEKDGGDIVKSSTKVNIPGNHDIYAHWTVSDTSSKHGKYSTILIFIIISTIILPTVVIGFKKISASRRSKNVMTPSAYSRIVSPNENDTAIWYSNESIKSILSRFYPRDCKRPTMRDALINAQLPDDKIDEIVEACENSSHAAADEGKLFEGFTIKDAAAIAMYTYEFGRNDYENNPYRIINKSLTERNNAGLQRAKGILYLVMTALRKLPRTPKRTLYRGVKAKMNLDEDHYCVGK